MRELKIICSGLKKETIICVFLFAVMPAIKGASSTYVLLITTVFMNYLRLEAPVLDLYSIFFKDLFVAGAGIEPAQASSVSRL